MENTVKKATKATAKEVAQVVVPKWERKNRVYRLTGGYANSPWLKLQSADNPKSKNRLLYKEKGKAAQAIRYSVNHISPFVSEQIGKGEVVGEHIIFKQGFLGVDEFNESLQKFLEVHPWNVKNGGHLFYEHDPAVEAKQEIDALDLEVKAMKLAFDVDINTASAILRPSIGVEIHEMKSELVTREVLRLAKKSPGKFIELLEDDQLMIKYMAYTSVDFGICSLTDAGRVYRWSENQKRLLSIPFGEDSYDAIAKWFTTDEGLEVMGKITKKLKK